jgi:hypothetical protein
LACPHHIRPPKNENAKLAAGIQRQATNADLKPVPSACLRAFASLRLGVKNEMIPPA